MAIIFFKSTNEFRQWLKQNHATEKEILVGFYKISTKKPSMIWSDSVDVALCFGWIDGNRKSIDAESYCIRFTPRNPKSIWSKINIGKVEKLKDQGLMTEAGLEVYNMRNTENSGLYSFENENRELDEIFLKIFKKNTEAWNFFAKQAPSYKKTVIHWIVAPKLEKTKLAHLLKLIEFSENKKKVF